MLCCEPRRHNKSSGIVSCRKWQRNERRDTRERSGWPDVLMCTSNHRPTVIRTLPASLLLQPGVSVSAVCGSMHHLRAGATDPNVRHHVIYVSDPVKCMSCDLGSVCTPGSSFSFRRIVAPRSKARMVDFHETSLLSAWRLHGQVVDGHSLLTTADLCLASCTTSKYRNDVIVPRSAHARQRCARRPLSAPVSRPLALHVEIRQCSLCALSIGQFAAFCVL